MIRIRLHFFATYYSLIGKRQLELDVASDCDVRTAIDHLLMKFPVLRQHWCNPAGELMPHLFVILNKQDISSLPDGLGTILQPGDELDFVPPVGGG
ncbi:MAG: MoaD family protein [Anaerolineaceae bacterium]|nr:MoaD family protein [Anaerolineaceae bacterium]